LSIGIEQVKNAILLLIAFVLSTTFHEFGHAWVANKLGDPTPKSQGRLTLSPVHHVDPIGTILLPLIMGLQLFGGPLLAWGRPVQTNPLMYTRRFSVRTGRMLVAIAGPLMNLAMAALVSVIVILGFRSGVLNEPLARGLIGYMVFLNLSLLFFNLLPIPPLDGGAVLSWTLPRSMQHIVEVLERWGFLILLGLLMVPGVMRYVMAPAYYLMDLWVGGLKEVSGL